MPPEIHLVEMVLCVYVALGHEQIVVVGGVDMRNALFIANDLHLGLQAGQAQTAAGLQERAAHRVEREASGADGHDGDQDDEPDEDTPDEFHGLRRLLNAVSEWRGCKSAARCTTGSAGSQRRRGIIPGRKAVPQRRKDAKKAIRAQCSAKISASAALSAP